MNDNFDKTKGSPPSPLDKLEASADQPTASLKAGAPGQRPDVAPTKGRSVVWWEPAMEIGIQVSGWIAVPIIAALFIGKWLDEKYHTDPWLFLTAMGIAFAISCFGIVSITLKYIKKIEAEAQAKKSSYAKASKDLSKLNQDKNIK